MAIPVSVEMIHSTKQLMYKAIQEGNLDTVKEICECYPNVLEDIITVNKDTALHVTVCLRRTIIIEYLLTKMSNQHLELVNDNGDTALSMAAIVGNIQAAKMIVSRNENLRVGANKYGRIPLLEAALHGEKQFVTYLKDSGEYAFRGSANSQQSYLFMSWLLFAGNYGLVLDLLVLHPELAEEEDSNGDSLLSLMAKKPDAFLSGTQLNFFERFMYCLAPRKLNSKGTAFSPEDDSDHSFLSTARGILWRTLELLVANSKEVQETKMTHLQVFELVKYLCLRIKDSPKAFSLLRPPLLLAAKLGVHEVVGEIMDLYPYAVTFIDDENRNIFQLAVMNHQVKVFNIILQKSECKQLLLMSEDIWGNNVLHLAAKLAPKNQLNRVSSPALQMQRELQWFESGENCSACLQKH